MIVLYTYAYETIAIKEKQFKNLRARGGGEPKGENIQLYFNLKTTDLFLAVLKAAKTNINVLVACDEDLLTVQCQETPCDERENV